MQLTNTLLLAAMAITEVFALPTDINLLPRQDLSDPSEINFEVPCGCWNDCTLKQYGLSLNGTVTEPFECPSQCGKS